ncbi:chromatin target of PRMT1 protein-like isoform X2 [Physella acuta]|uniref:chromatin target of PRMT1 protein-like isoform X2 n=1 Tax=Physella acuta TaxID=109671 RepID=UPI0027DD548F|nr:chromatin target of PRMT1 protein-like isoform X2 [Physella acuta]
MTTVPTKIVLKSTTRMSLNDRFSSIAPNIQNIRANMAVEHQVSAANRRLAQQLANRPGLQAVPTEMFYQQSRGRGQGNMNNQMRRKSLQQRLGKTNVKNRLSLPATPQRGRGRGRGRGNAAVVQAPTGDNLYFTNKTRGRGNFSPRGTPRGRGTFRGRGRGTFNRFEENGRPGDNRRRGGRGRGGPDRFTGQNTQNRRGGAGAGMRGARGRGNRRGGRGQGRGGRGGRGRGANPSVSVQDLDSQLDEYMAKTKSHLDSELDAYMSEATN